MLNTNTINTQSLYRHSTNIIVLMTDTMGQLYFLDHGNKMYTYNHGIVENIELQIDSLTLIPSEKLNYMFYDGSKVLSIQNKRLEEAYGDFKGSPIYLADATLVSIVENRFFIRNNMAEAECIFNKDDRIKQISYYKGELMVLAQDSFYLPCKNRAFALPFNASGFCQNANELYFSSYDNGLWIMKNGRFRKLFYPGIEIPNSIDKLINRNGTLWMITTEKQLLTFDLTRQILRAVDRDVSNYILDLWNYLWYVKENILVGESYYVNEDPPKLEIQSIRHNNIILDKDFFFNIELDKGIQVTTSSYYYPSVEKTITQYKLNEGEWINFEGQFELQVDKSGYNKLYIRIGKDENNFSNPEVIEFWAEQNIIKTYWPHVIIFIILLLTLMFYFLRKAKFENQKLIRSKQELNMKLKVLEAEQKQKQSQMSPHFIYNVLNSIKGLIVLNENQKARKAINDFAQLMRTVLDDSDKLTIDLQSEVEFLNAYVSLQKMTSSTDFDFELINRSSAKEISPMLIQPFLENAIIHGIDSSDKRGRIRVLIEDINHYLKVTIEDSGGTYDVNSSESIHKSRASEIFLDRVNRLDKWKEQKPLEYVVELNDNGKTQSTRCILHIPKI